MKEQTLLSEEVRSEKIKREDETQTTASLFKRKRRSSQATINNMFKKSLREEACQGIASFFYKNQCYQLVEIAPPWGYSVAFFTPTAIDHVNNGPKWRRPQYVVSRPPWP